jgi:ABC-type dipeptide/oligopeptide/nickel transport system permease component
VQGIVLVFASVFVVINIGVDILYGFIDPRVSLE